MLGIVKVNVIFQGIRDSPAHRRASGCFLPPRILPRSRPIAEGFSRRVGGCQCGSPSGKGPRVLMGRDIDNPWHGTQSSYGPGAGIPKLPAQQSLFHSVFSGMVGIIGIKQEKDSTWQKAKAPLARSSRMISPRPSSEPTASTQNYLRHLKTIELLTCQIPSGS